jgi:DNA-binding ferritin-like protein
MPKAAMQNAGANTLKSLTSVKGTIYTTIVPTFLQMLNTIKLYHWNITNFAAHKASDELYSKLNEKIDEFVEVMLGKPEIGRASGALNVSVIPLPPVMDIKKQIEVYKNFLLELSKNTQFNIPANADLLAIRDEILAALNQFLYLLTLS